MAPQKKLLLETATLRRVWKDPEKRFRISNHARIEMANDGILDADVRHVIPRYEVMWVEWKQDELWHVVGRDLDGRSIRLVLAVYPAVITVKLVTAMVL